MCKPRSGLIGSVSLSGFSWSRRQWSRPPRSASVAPAMLRCFYPFPRPWIISGVILAMGVVACLATVQSVTFAGIMTLVEVGGLVLIIVAGLGHGYRRCHPPSGDLAFCRRYDGLDRNSRHGTHRRLCLHRLRASRQRCGRNEGAESYPAARIVPDAGPDRASLRGRCVDRRDGSASAGTRPLFGAPCACLRTAHGPAARYHERNRHCSDAKRRHRSHDHDCPGDLWPGRSRQSAEGPYTAEPGDAHAAAGDRDRRRRDSPCLRWPFRSRASPI